ncbi:MAG: hypothetical protein OEW31_09150 [Thermoleophilia bacterium]|nr:hypothetical protein [Thermoleophilia bacterium]
MRLEHPSRATPLPAILAAGHLGYRSAHFFALTAFLLLRRGRPTWPRPIKPPSPWLLIAGVLAAANALFIIIGASNPSLDRVRRHEGDGDRDLRAPGLRPALPLPPGGEDHERPHWRDQTPRTPDHTTHGGGPA